MERLTHVFTWIAANPQVVEASIEYDRRLHRIAARKRYHASQPYRLKSKWQARLRAYMAPGMADKPTRFGCTLYELRFHIESLFRDGMTWENYDSHWEVDHVFPLCRFTLPDEIFSAFNYTNLRPRLKHKNRMDGLVESHGWREARKQKGSLLREPSVI